MQVPVAKKSISDKEINSAIDAIKKGVWTEGEYCEKFSTQLKEYHKRSFCQLVNSGSSANLIALNACMLAYDWQAGHEVITCALGFPTTVNPIIQLGLNPVFVDAEGLNINPNLIEEKITENTKAIMIAHTLGFPFDIKAIKRICNKHGLLLIEDTCDALASRDSNDILCGTMGDVSTFSFYPAHCITTIEGGAVLTNNPKIARIMNSITSWGRACICAPGENNRCGHRFDGQYGKLPKGWDHKYTYINVGYNLKMTDISGAIGFEQMKRLDNFVKIRRDNYQEYENNIIYNSLLLTPGVNPFGYVLVVDDAISFIKKLLDKGIDARLVMGGNLLRQPYLMDYDDFTKYPGATYTADHYLWIGVQPSLSQDEKEYVIKTINEL